MCIWLVPDNRVVKKTCDSDYRLNDSDLRISKYWSGDVVWWVSPSGSNPHYQKKKKGKKKISRYHIWTSVVSLDSDSNMGKKLKVYNQKRRWF